MHLSAGEVSLLNLIDRNNGILASAIHSLCERL